MDEQKPKWIKYQYVPKIGAEAFFLSVFTIIALIHLFYLIRKRTWYFIPFFIGCVFEAVGYGARIISSEEAPDYSTKPYAVQYLLLLIAPALFAASIYMVLGRIVVLLEAQSHSLVPVAWLTKIFVTADVLSLGLQASGGGIVAAAKDADGFKTGENVILGGLFVQLFAFAIFVIVTGLFHLRILSVPTAVAQVTYVPWQRFMMVLYVLSGLILIRSVFRVAEYIQGATGTIQSSEWWLFVFDATLMTITAGLPIVIHPSKITSSQAGKTGSSTDLEQEVEKR